MPLVAAAEPRGPTVAAGNATVSGQGTGNLTINQSTQSAIINWQSFNIGGGETTRFIQPNASSVALNRVTGDRAPSSIFGSLTANGRVYLVNPEGFIFGPGAVINTAGFLATTHDIRNNDFMAGRYLFTLPGNPTASIINQGQITVADTGIAALVAPGVRNDGVITARLGRVALASANAFTLDLYGDNLINFAVSSPIASQVIDPTTGKPLGNLVDNRGTLSANGGVVAMTATTARSVVDNIINNSGVIEAKSVGLQNGQIVLGAATQKTKSSGAPTQKVAISGTLDASGRATGQKGGTIRVTGEDISIANAKLDAAGDAGGGKILIGGDYMGGRPNPFVTSKYPYLMEAVSIDTATNVTVAANVTVDASALTSGNGGKVVAWSDGDTAFKGTILARGGLSGGNGGFAEVSGLHSVNFAGLHADLTAPLGHRGALLFDPAGGEVIDAAKAQTISELLNQGNDVFVLTTVTGGVIATLGTTGLSQMDADAGIFINANILKTAGGDASLYFDAGHGITVAPGVVIGSSSRKLNVYFSANWLILDPNGNVLLPAQIGRVTFGTGSKVYTNGGEALMNPGQGAEFITKTTTKTFLSEAEFMAYANSIFDMYTFPAGFVSITSIDGSNVYTLTSTILPGGDVPAVVASTQPLPGITVKFDRASVPVAFSLLNEIAKPLGITADELWQARNKLDGMDLTPTARLFDVANIEPGAGPAEANSNKVYVTAALLVVEKVNPDYLVASQIAFEANPAKARKILEVAKLVGLADQAIDELVNRLGDTIVADAHKNIITNNLLGIDKIKKYISSGFAAAITESLKNWIVFCSTGSC